MENNGGNSKLYITSSVMFDAAGTYIDVRLVYPGVRKRDKQLEKIPKTGVTGEWKHSVSDHGYVTRDIFLEILQDLDHHLTTANIKGCGHFKQFYSNLPLAARAWWYQVITIIILTLH